MGGKLNFIDNHQITILKNLIKTELKNKYKTRNLGLFWSIIEPLFMIGILLLVFTKLFDYNNPRFPEYIVIGFFIWEFFATATRSGLLSLFNNGAMIKKHAFPKYIIILANSLVTLFEFIIKFIALIIILTIVSKAQSFDRIIFSWYILLLPILILMQYLFIIGINMILSTLYIRFKDLENIWNIVLQVGFYATPIIYPLSLLPEKYMIIQYFNPMAYFLSLYRAILLTPTKGNYHLFLPIIGFVVIFLFIGTIIYLKTNKKIAELI